MAVRGIKVVDLKKVNKKKKNPVRVRVEKKRKNAVQSVKIFKNPLGQTKTELLSKLNLRLREYFSCIPENLRKTSVLKILEELKADKTITVSIGDCSYIFEGGDFKDKDKIKDPRVKDILTTMAKNLKNL